MNEEKQVSEYKRSVGREPRNLPEDHPDLWQWQYKGTKEEREALAMELGLEDDNPVIDGQEEMF